MAITSFNLITIDEFKNWDEIDPILSNLGQSNDEMAISYHDNYIKQAISRASIIINRFGNLKGLNYIKDNINNLDDETKNEIKRCTAIQTQYYLINTTYYESKGADMSQGSLSFHSDNDMTYFVVPEVLTILESLGFYSSFVINQHDDRKYNNKIDPIFGDSYQSPKISYKEGDERYVLKEFAHVSTDNSIFIRDKAGVISQTDFIVNSNKIVKDIIDNPDLKKKLKGEPGKPGEPGPATPPTQEQVNAAIQKLPTNVLAKTDFITRGATVRINWKDNMIQNISIIDGSEPDTRRIKLRLNEETVIESNDFPLGRGENGLSVTDVSVNKLDENTINFDIKLSDDSIITTNNITLPEGRQGVPGNDGANATQEQVDEAIAKAKTYALSEHDFIIQDDEVFVNWEYVDSSIQLMTDFFQNQITQIHDATYSQYMAFDINSNQRWRFADYDTNYWYMFYLTVRLTGNRLVTGVLEIPANTIANTEVCNVISDTVSGSSNNLRFLNGQVWVDNWNGDPIYVTTIRIMRRRSL